MPNPGFYRIYLQSLCCEEGQDPDCNPIDNLNGSICFLVGDAAPACTMDDTQTLQLTSLSSTEIKVEWEDFTPENWSYEILARPISPCLDEPKRNIIVELPANTPADNDRSTIIDQLLPNTLYEITVRKNCSGVLCPAFTVDIVNEISTQNINAVSYTHLTLPTKA